MDGYWKGTLMRDVSEMLAEAFSEQSASFPNVGDAAALAYDGINHVAGDAREPLTKMECTVREGHRWCLESEGTSFTSAPIAGPRAQGATLGGRRKPTSD